MDDRTLKDFMSTFIFLQKFNCFEAIDAMFGKMLKEDWSTESLATNKILIVTFLRTNCQFKEKISNYKDFLSKSVKYLESYNIEPKSLLHGLI